MTFRAARFLTVGLSAVALLGASAAVAGAQDPLQRAPGAPSLGALPLDRIAAVVGTKVILVSDIEAALAAQQTPMPADSTERRALQRAVLDQLIDVEVLIQRAEKDTSLLIDELEVQQMADAQIAKVRGNFPTDKEYRDALVEAGFGTPDDYREKQVTEIRRRQMQETYIAELRRNGKFVTVNVSEKDVNAEMEKMGGQLPDRPATMGFQQIVVPTVPGEESRKRARSLIDSLFLALQDKPSEFEEAARKFSQDGSAENGGDLGWNRRGNMVPEFDRVMFMLNPGVVSPPVESRYGWHLIRVDRVQPAEVKARHILIRAATDSADELRATQLADSVRALWDSGVSFDSLRTLYHDERSGEDAIIPEVAASDLPPAYATAIGTSPVGTLVGPFAIEDQASGTRKFVVLRLTRTQPAGKMSLDEARRNLRRSMQEAYSFRRMLDSMRKQTYVSVRF
jgi:peptidyl-prolyl cis-trans isomerase SurA